MGPVSTERRDVCKFRTDRRPFEVFQSPWTKAVDMRDDYMAGTQMKFQDPANVLAVLEWEEYIVHNR